MDKTIVIHQPDFVPYLGFFHRLLEADHFIILDHVKISKNGWVHRDKIKAATGELWITLPVKKINGAPLIYDAKIEKNKLFYKLPRMIEASYRKAKYFNEIYPALENLFEMGTDSLIEFNMAFIMQLCNWFDIKVSISFSSKMYIASKKSEMNAELVKKLGGNVYLSGVGASTYHDQEPFDSLDIDVKWHKFDHPIYNQMYNGFIPNLSSLDILFNCGISRSKELLRGKI